MVQIDKLSSQGQFAQAAAVVEGAKAKNYGKKNALLYHMDRGMLLHLAGSYGESNSAFEEAKKLSKELYTKVLRTEAASFLTSDNVRPYAGEDFEQAQLHIFCALNYVMLGQGREALVEARQVDNLLKKLQTDYGHKNIYTRDAFARSLMGLLYEDEGDINDAHISFLQALKAYDVYAKDYGVGTPPDLLADALGTARRLGFTDRISEIQKQWGGQVPSPRPRNSGEVVVLHYQGLAPRKVDSFFEVSAGKGWAFVDAQRPVGEEAQQVEKARSIFRSVAADTMIRVAFPSFEPTPYALRGLTVRADDVPAGISAVIVQDIGAIAVKNLKDRMLRERTKAIARAMIKWTLAQKVSEKVEKEKGAVAGWLVKSLLNTVNTATEVADKRSWETIPDKIGMARLVLPEGEHTLHLTFLTASGESAETREVPVTVTSGRRSYVIERTVK